MERIKRNIVAFIGGDTRRGLNIGQSVIRVVLPTEVLRVPGVIDFTLQISPDGVNYGWENITIAAREKAVTDESKVDVS